MHPALNINAIENEDIFKIKENNIPIFFSENKKIN